MNRSKACLLALAVVTANVFAADPPPESKDLLRAFAQACRPDAERFCANVEKGGGRKLACLRAHATELSPACKDGLASAATARKGGPAH